MRIRVWSTYDVGGKRTSPRTHDACEHALLSRPPITSHAAPPGTTNPGGRLPFTVPVNITGLPSLADVAMSGGGAGHPGRTYRYTTYPVAHPFGFGLSYTTFAYTNLRRSAAQIRAGDALQLNVTLTNTGARDGDEVVQVRAGGWVECGMCMCMCVRASVCVRVCVCLCLCLGEWGMSHSLEYEPHALLVVGRA